MNNIFIEEVKLLKNNDWIIEKLIIKSRILSTIAM